MDLLIIAALIVLAIILLLTELFIIPGFSIAGILAGGCFIYANYYAFTHIGTGGGVVTLLISVVACVGSIVRFMRSKTLDRLALKQDIDSKIDRDAEATIQPGDCGVTTTRLALIGYAEINGKVVEVKSDDGFLDEKTPIVVNRVTDGTILVERIKQ